MHDNTSPLEPFAAQRMCVLRSTSTAQTHPFSPLIYQHRCCRGRKLPARNEEQRRRDADALPPNTGLGRERARGHRPVPARRGEPARVSNRRVDGRQPGRRGGSCRSRTGEWRRRRRRRHQRRNVVCRKRRSWGQRRGGIREGCGRGTPRGAQGDGAGGGRGRGRSGPGVSRGCLWRPDGGFLVRGCLIRLGPAGRKMGAL